MESQHFELMPSSVKARHVVQLPRLENESPLYFYLVITSNIIIKKLKLLLFKKIWLR